MTGLADIRPPILAVIGLAIWLVALFATAAPGHARPGDLAQTVELIADEVTHLAIWVTAWAVMTHCRQGRSRLAEPPRVLRRHQLLRRWSHEQVKEVFA